MYPDLHLKLPGKRLLGNNFDPGKLAWTNVQVLS